MKVVRLRRERRRVENCVLFGRVLFGLESRGGRRVAIL